ncbi:MAG: bifunctional hydroxymethylpyrimidine kinase/phosphomethylpyrimidine kinase [Cardiobacteriaceae bacterium]|nr:bifunctional hydroxymethylpyrimidine kinase/phosphomethylpyrimidine kinase [Cardiobacteriaceae bacterium]
MTHPIALTIAGSDSGGGAGIQADLKAFSALGVYGASVITAITAQNTREVTAVHMVPPEIIRAQLAAVFDDLPPQAVKIGMLGDVATIAAVAAFLEGHAQTPIVLDPVMVAKSGDKLLQDEAIAALRERLLPLATLITPNLPEAEVLTGLTIRNRDDMPRAAEALLQGGVRAVLLKGGHLQDAHSNDFLTDGHTTQWLPAPRHPSRNTHGTGCTLSSAIAAGIARGLALTDAVQEAKSYIGAAIAAADRLGVGHGHGHGPVHHFHRWW